MSVPGAPPQAIIFRTFDALNSKIELKAVPLLSDITFIELSGIIPKWGEKQSWFDTQRQLMTLSQYLLEKGMVFCGIPLAQTGKGS